MHVIEMMIDFKAFDCGCREGWWVDVNFDF
jgi:hypothetical protein